MKPILLLPLSLLLLCGAVWMNRSGAALAPDGDRAEEHELRRRWEEKMLADPATGKIPEGARWQELAFLRTWQDQHPQARRLRGVEWKSRGPWNVGGRTRGMAMDVKDPRHLIAGGVSGGIWKSYDGGRNWTRASELQSHPGCVSITQDTRPGRTHIWYALSGELYGTSASGGSAFYLGDGAFVSTDDGETWSPLGSTAGAVPSTFSSAFQGGWRIVASPVDSVDACVYMATYGSIYRSRDTGKTWTAVLGNGNDSYFTDVAVTASGIVYATLSSDGSTKGFFRSADGVHFTNITPSLLKSYDRTVIGINPDNQNEVYFLSELPSDTSGGVKTANYEGTAEYVSLLRYNYLSGDGSGNGGQWSNLSTNLPVDAASAFDRFNSQGGYDLVVQVQPGTGHVVVGGTNLYISTSAFTSPTATTQIGGYGPGTTLPNFSMYPNHHPDLHDVLFIPGQTGQAYTVSDGGVHFTGNINATPVVWENRSMGYITSQFYCLAIDESRPYDQYLLGGLQDNGNYLTNTNDPQSAWRMNINGDGAYAYIAPGRSFYVISTQLGNVRKVLLDERGNVLGRKRIDPAGYDKSAYNFINHLAVDPNNNNVLFLPIGKKLARLDNLREIACNNDNTKLSSGWTFSDTITTASLSATTKAEITFVAVSKKPAGVVYAGTSNREVYRVDNAYSAQPKLTRLGINRLPGSGYVSGIAIDPEDANKLLVCFSNYNATSLVYSSDGGQTWYLVGGNLEGTVNSSSTNPSVRCVNILTDHNGKRHYFAGTSIGLWHTDSLVPATSAGSNVTAWEQESPDGIGAAVVTDIRVRQSDGYIAVATHGNGVFDSYYFGAKRPTAFLQAANIKLYPNPAANEIYFSFSPEDDHDLEGIIIDLMGRRIKTAFKGFFVAGNYTLRIPLDDMPTGYYIMALNKSDQTTLNGTPFIVQRP
jgi:photosystem II stability/assembly factor-like uncharacterized protein